MKQVLLDVNVLFALLFSQHEHHEIARRWANELSAGEAVVCRTVQFSVIRLLGNRSVVGPHAVSLSRAWALVSKVLEDERFEFAPEPEGIDEMLPRLFRCNSPALQLVADIYLAAFAIASSRRVASFDRGFVQFQGLEVEVLGV